MKGEYMTRKDLINAFNTAKDNRLDICVKVTIPGQKECEYIVNKLDRLRFALNISKH
jgi:hypothetical protein